MDRLVGGSDGLIYDYGDGDSEFTSHMMAGEFSPPSLDFGTLVGTTDGSSYAISGAGEATSSSIVGISTSLPNSYAAGQLVVISGITPSGYDGIFTILSVTSSTGFTYKAEPGLGSASVSGAFR